FQHLPFNYLNKRAFTYKFVSYLGLGFALPWVAVGWIWYETDSSCEKDVMTEQDCESGIVPVATKTLTEELIALFRWLYLSVVRVSQNPPLFTTPSSLYYSYYSYTTCTNGQSNVYNSS
ncbi:hypothetical protein EV360DRAFT_34987, partial [Lentinula raphanica]